MPIRPSIDVKSLRHAKALSQEMLATMAGVSVRSVRRMEAGHGVSAETLRCVAAALDASAGAPVMPAPIPPGFPVDATKGMRSPLRDFPRWPWLDSLVLVLSAVLVIAIYTNWRIPLVSDPIRAMVMTAIVALLCGGISTTYAGDRRYLLATIILIIGGAETFAWTAESFYIARVGHSVAVMFGLLAIAGHLLRKAFASPSWTGGISRLVVAGFLVTAGSVPILGVVVELTNAAAHTERIFGNYKTRMEAVRLKGDAKTPRDTWEAVRLVSVEMASMPLRSWPSIPATDLDFDLNERRRVAFVACRKLDPHLRDGCPALKDPEFHRQVPVPYSQFEVFQKLFVWPDRFV